MTTLTVRSHPRIATIALVLSLLFATTVVTSTVADVPIARASNWNCVVAVTGVGLGVISLVAEPVGFVTWLLGGMSTAAGAATLISDCASSSYLINKIKAAYAAHACAIPYWQGYHFDWMFHIYSTYGNGSGKCAGIFGNSSGSW